MRILVTLFVFLFQCSQMNAQLTFVMNPTTTYERTNTKPAKEVQTKFSVDKHDAGAVLNWESPVKNPVRFIVEKSYSGTDFKAISTINVTDNKSQFSVQDLKIKYGRNLYRIVTIDTNGNKFKSNIQNLQCKKQNDFNIALNEDQNRLNVYLTNPRQAILNIYSDNFKLLLYEKTNGQDDVIAIDISEFEPGDYIIQVQGKDSSYMKSFTK